MVLETRLFQRCAAAVWTEEQRDDFVSWIAVDTKASEVIPGAGWSRKVRLARGEAVLIVVYAKAKFDNMPTAIFKALERRL